jgi:hypothetical protein
MTRKIESIAIAALIGCLGACGGQYLGLPKASPGKYGIVGYVGKSSQQAAPSETVTLRDANGQPVASATTDFMGKYQFYPLPAGSYTLVVGQIERPVVLADNHQRVDIDLSAEGGKMDYAAGAARSGKPGGGGPVVAQGPNDPELQKQFAGFYWGFSGVNSSTGGGGTERKKNFCADGRFYDMTESNYYGRGHDQYGEEEMRFSNVSTPGATVARWTITGTMEKGVITITYPNGSTSQIHYEVGKDPRDYSFDGDIVSRGGATPTHDPCQ